MSTSIKIKLTFISLFCLVQGAHAQSQLDSYIAEALKNNDGVKQQQFQLEKSMLALQEAKTLFLPSASLQASYTKAAGGRTIDLPIGDLLNPAYSTLNELTHTNNFPTLKNQSFLLNPDNFYDAKVRTSMPLINAEVRYNKLIKKESISLYKASVNVYKRALVKDVKEAYFRYFQAVQAVKIYQDALVLVEKNIKTNESLLKNGVRNNTALTRAQTEKQRITAQIAQAENTVSNARAYFNFLLNRSLNAAISIDSSTVLQTAVTTDMPTGPNSVAGREELQQLAIKQNLYGLNKKMEQAYIIPKVNTFLDLGSQGYNWAINNKTNYYLLGVNLQWDLFAWGMHRYKVQQAGVDVKSAQLETDATEKAFQLQLTQSVNDYNTAVSNYNSARSQQVFAEKYYNDQLKAYSEGQLLYIELLDAETQLTNAQLQVSLALAGVQIARAETERNLATYPIN